MADLRGFDASQVNPAVGFEPVPPGQYLAVVTDSGMRPTKNGTGQYLQLTFQVIDGPYKGQQLWARLNLDNPNAKAVEIARAELSAVCRAVGVLAPNDSVELHDLPLVLSVACRNRPDTGDITNEVKGYAKKDPPAQAAPAPPAGPPPWKRS